MTNIKSHIPLILDLAEHNYDAWRELFLTHSITFDIAGHFDGTTFRLETMMLNGTRETAWSSFWFTGLCLLISSKAHLRPTVPLRTLWIRIENKVKNNKEAPATQLDNELRTTEISDLTIEAYYQKLKSLSDRLANVNAPIADRTLVTYLLNWLNERFDNSINVSQHLEPFPSFATSKLILHMEETRLKRTNKHVAQHSDHVSSSTALTVTTDNNNSNRGNP